VVEATVQLPLFVDGIAKVSGPLALTSRIEANPAVARVDYVTKEQALQRLQDIAAQRPDFQVADISSNPLPASLEIKMADARAAKTLANDLRAEIGKGIVCDVVDNPQVVDQLLSIDTELL